MAHRGEATTAIAHQVGVSVQTVSHWRSRLARQGLEGLQGVARSGRPRRLGQTQRLELLALACEPAEPQGRATPTLDELVDRAVQRGVVKQISRSHLQRILQAGSGLSFTSRHCTPAGSIGSSCCSASTRAASCDTPVTGPSNTCASAPMPSSSNATSRPSLSNGQSPVLSYKQANP